MLVQNEPAAVVALEPECDCPHDSVAEVEQPQGQADHNQPEEVQVK